jgi:CheY-like chemotaxis protein
MTDSILLVEDTPLDAELTQLALFRCGRASPVIHAHNGRVALDILDAINSPGPWVKLELILLDVRMPLLDGFDVLKYIRAAPHLQDVPVIVLTSIPIEADRMRAGLLGAKAYMSKASDIDDFCHLLHLTLQPLIH